MTRVSPIQLTNGACAECLHSNDFKESLESIIQACKFSLAPAENNKVCSSSAATSTINC